jgi:hypothetical protein
VRALQEGLADAVEPGTDVKIILNFGEKIGEICICDFYTRLHTDSFC